MAAPYTPDTSASPSTTAAHAEPMKLDRADGSSTLELYRAALGPLRRDYYLRAFTRFDAVGKTGPSVNPVAGLLTLNWLAFRGLWAVALVYVGALVFAALVILGIGRVLFQLSEPAQWALAGLVLLTSVVVPGLWGNAWLYAALSKKMERALVDTATLEEACAVLSAQAGGQRRAGIVLGVNVALAAVVAALVSAWPSAESLPLQTSKMEQARATTETATSGLAQQSIAAAASAARDVSAVSATNAASAPVATAASEPMAVPASAPANTASSAPSASASNPLVATPLSTEETQAHAARMSKGVVQMAGPMASVATATPAKTQTLAPQPPPTPSTSTQTYTPAPSPAPAPIAPDKVLTAPAITPTAAKPASQASAAQTVTASPSAPTKPTSKEAHAPSEKSKKAKASDKKPHHEAPAPVAREKKKKEKEKATTPAPEVNKKASAEAEHYLINVGLFADANNARNATTKLRDAGLPVVSSTLQSAKGERTRVRVGPFETQVEADRVAEKIRALQLDAVVVKP